MIKKGIITIFFCMAVLLGWSCSNKINIRKPLVLLAVLPFSNQSNDVNGQVIVRKYFDEEIRARGYKTVDIDTIDGILRDMGVTDGGQLNSVSAKDIAAKAGTDYLIYGDVIQYFHGVAFDLLPAGLVNKTEVKAAFKLVNASNNSVVWRVEKYGFRKDKIKEKNDIFKDMIKGAIKDPLETVSEGVSRRAASDFPVITIGD